MERCLDHGTCEWLMWAVLDQASVLSSDFPALFI